MRVASDRWNRRLLWTLGNTCRQELGQDCGDLEFVIGKADIRGQPDVLHRPAGRKHVQAIYQAVLGCNCHQHRNAMMRCEHVHSDDRMEVDIRTHAKHGGGPCVSGQTAGLGRARGDRM
jgi:hypothetical protein